MATYRSLLSSNYCQHIESVYLLKTAKYWVHTIYVHVNGFNIDINLSTKIFVIQNSRLYFNIFLTMNNLITYDNKH